MSDDEEVVPAAHLRPYQADEREPWDWGYVPFEAIEAMYVCLGDAGEDLIPMEMAEVGNWIGTIKARKEKRYR